jgi:predicted Abi (CAAX) family protease
MLSSPVPPVASAGRVVCGQTGWKDYEKKHKGGIAVVFSIVYDSTLMHKTKYPVFRRKSLNRVPVPKSLGFSQSPN